MGLNIKIFTTEMPDKEYTSLGIVNGIQVKSMNVFTDLMTGIANIFGTGKRDWTKVKELFDSTREEAIEEMKKNAVKMGATSIIGVRIDVSELSRGRGQGMLVVAAYGTAIKKNSNMESTGGKKIYKNRHSNKNKKYRVKYTKKTRTNRAK